MKKKTLSRLTVGAMLLMLASCSQDELTEQSEKLSEHMYPVEIGSVTVADMSSDLQTRMTENSNGSGSVWEWDGTELIGLSVNGYTDRDTANYTLNKDKTLTATYNTKIYWQDTKEATVTAWYPAYNQHFTGETVYLTKQASYGLEYVLKGTGTGSYNKAINLTFTHQLSKIRVELEGDKAYDLNWVYLYSYGECNNRRGVVTGQKNSEGWIEMRNMELTYGKRCFEACVVPGYTISKIKVRYFDLQNKVNKEKEVAITPSITPQAGKIHTVKISTYSATDLSSQTGDITITDSETYHFKTTSTTSNRIIVNGTGITPTIYLHDVAISTSNGPGISIEGSSNSTINIVGINNTITSSSNAGIYVASGTSVTITSNDKDNNSLTVKGINTGIGSDVQSSQLLNAGNISISNTTLTAQATDASKINYIPCFGAGIGAAGDANCGTITITNSKVSAYGDGDGSNEAAAAIGGGSKDFSAGNFGTITITDSNVYAYLNNRHADYIGKGGNSIQQTASGLQINANVKNSTVYKYIYNSTSMSYPSQGSVTYDENGNTE